MSREPGLPLPTNPDYYRSPEWLNPPPVPQWVLDWLEETRTLRDEPTRRNPMYTPPGIYIAGPMRGYPNFNFPAFFAAEEHLRELFPNAVVVNPARADNDKYGTDISEGNHEGCEDKATEEHGFDLRHALGYDLGWICEHATAVYMLKGWGASKGAIAERAAAEALGLTVMYQDTERTWTDTENDMYEDGVIQGRFLAEFANG